MTDFNLSERIIVEQIDIGEYQGKISANDVKEFIEQIEFDLLKKYKMASLPIMEIIKKRAGDRLTK